MIRPTTNEVAGVLAKVLSDQQVADLLNVLLGCEADERLTDREAMIGDRLFGCLVALRPECVEIAQNS